MTIRDSFVERFGEEQAQKLEAACDYHVLGVGMNNDSELVQVSRAINRLFGNDLDDHASDDRGSDPFKYVVLACLGYECVSKFADYHGITISELEFDLWILECAELDSFDGDHPDYMHKMLTKLGGDLGRQRAEQPIIIIEEKNDADSD